MIVCGPARRTPGQGIVQNGDVALICDCCVVLVSGGVSTRKSVKSLCVEADW